MKSKLLVIFKLILLVIMMYLTFLGSKNYPGSKILLYIFTIVFYIFIQNGFFQLKSYFSFYLSIFFPIGIWAKLILHLKDNNMIFGEGVGDFDFTGASFDKVLLFSIIGIFGFLFASYFIKYIKLEARISSYNKSNINKIFKTFKPQSVLLKIFSKQLKLLIILFFIFCFIVSMLNIKYKIFQRGYASEDTPFILKAFVTWGVLYGFDALFTYFINKQYIKKNSIFFSTTFSLLNSFITSISILSRGFILNTASVFVVLVQKYFEERKISTFKLLSLFAIFVFLFWSSGTMVSTLRYLYFETGLTDIDVNAVTANTRSTSKNFESLFVDRWVGVDGLIASTSYKGNRSDAFEKIWNEPKGSALSVFDQEILKSNYAKTALNSEIYITKNLRFVSIPGLFGWLAILDSYILIFFGAFIFFLFFFLFEFAISMTTSNMFFISVLSQVMAFRVVHFGYLPKNTYQLLLSVILTVILMKVIEISSNENK